MGSHSSDGHLIVCPKCGQQGLTKAQYIEHKKVCPGAPPTATFRCPICGNEYPTQARLDSHRMNMNHWTPPTPPTPPTPTEPKYPDTVAFIEVDGKRTLASLKWSNDKDGYEIVAQGPDLVVPPPTLVSPVTVPFFSAGIASIGFYTKCFTYNGGDYYGYVPAEVIKYYYGQMAMIVARLINDGDNDEWKWDNIGSSELAEWAHGAFIRQYSGGSVSAMLMDIETGHCFNAVRDTDGHTWEFDLTKPGSLKDVTIEGSYYKDRQLTGRM